MTADAEDPTPQDPPRARADQAGPGGREETHAAQYDGERPGSVTNIVRGNVGSVIQLGHVYGDINL